MGRVNLKRRFFILGAAVGVLTAALILYVLYVFKSTDLTGQIINEARIEVSDLVRTVEKNDYSKVKQYTFARIDLSGRIVRSNKKDLKEGRNVNLKKYAGIAGYTMHNEELWFVEPVIVDEKQTGILVIFDYPYKNSALDQYGTGVVLVPFFIGAVICILLYFIIKTAIKDVLNPLNDLKHITEQIAKHDYEERLIYDYDGEVGSLCHDFEELRDELCITRKRELKMRKNEKELLACLSHDLKTPLASISGYVEGIKSGIVTSQEEIDRYLDIIISKIKFVAKLIDDILEHSKQDLDELGIELKEIYSSDLMDDVLGEISIEVAKAGFHFTCEKIPDVLLMADKYRIHQVFENVVGNGIKYTKAGGSIEIGFQIYEKDLVISVKDTGKGISVVDLPFIFDKFYRSEKARTMNIPGSGLGLNISKYIIEKHGGRMECDSILGEGTVIRFSLPLL